MTNRKRNLFVLFLVLALLAGSAWAISNKSTVLGLDLRGGTELVYQGQPTPQVPDVKPEDVDRAIEIIRDRVDSLGVSEPEITRIGLDQVEIGLPDVSDSDRAIDQIGTTAQLYLYDFEPNVIPPDADVPNPEARPYNRLYDAVEAAAKQDPVPVGECGECTTNGLVYAFNSNTLEPVGEPAESEADIRAQFDGELPPDTELVEVPRGTIVVERTTDDDPSTEVDESLNSASEFFVLKDNPGLSGDQIKDPKPDFDQFNQPIVTFDFTDEGRQAFQEVTREIVDSRRRRVLSGDRAAVRRDPLRAGGPVLGHVRDRPRQRADLEPDHQLRRQPRRDRRPHRRPDLRGSRRQESQDLAEVLQIGALPIKLAPDQPVDRLGDARRAGARPGPQGGPRRPRDRPPLPDRSTTGCSGVIAGLGLLVYAVFFLALIKLIPITLTLPGIAGLILTIGVAADSNIVIFERIKEEVRRGPLDDLGDRRGLQARASRRSSTRT